MVGTETLFLSSSGTAGGRLAAGPPAPAMERLGRGTIDVVMSWRCVGRVHCGRVPAGCPRDVRGDVPRRLSWGDSGGRRRARRSQARSRPRARRVAAGPNECQTYGPAPEQASQGLVRGRMEVTGD